MSFTWPEFTNPEALEGNRSWTARFDSYDQRNEDCYYMVTVSDAGRENGHFMVQVGTEFAGDDWTGPAFIDELRSRIASVAADGKTNTDYRGPADDDPYLDLFGVPLRVDTVWQILRECAANPPGEMRDQRQAWGWNWAAKLVSESRGTPIHDEAMRVLRLMLESADPDEVRLAKIFQPPTT
jgi:hypothetical protein